MIGLAKSLAKELGSRNVRVNVIAPGYITTELTDVLPEPAREGPARPDAARPAGRAGRRRARRAVPGLRRSVLRHGSGARRRRRARDVRECGAGDHANGGRTTRRRHGDRDGDAARRRPGVVLGRRSPPGSSGAAADPDDRRRPAADHLRLRGQGLRSDRRPRPQDGPAQRSLRAAGRGRRARGRRRRPPRRSSAHGQPERIGTSIATGIGGLRTLELAHQHLFEKGADRMSPMWITMLIPNMASGMVSMELGTRGPAAASCTACAASSMAIGDAASYIRDGRCDAMIVGGAEATITPHGHRRVLRDARHLARATTTRERRQPAVRPRARRLRDGRGRGDAGARGARAREGPRRHDLRRAARLRPLGGRAPRHRARPLGREARPGPC